MLYRVLRALDTGHLPGDVVSGDKFKDTSLPILVRVGALSPVSAPPLDTFPGWKLRAERFTEAGYDAIGILKTDDETLAEAIGSNIQSIQRWRAELEGYLGLDAEMMIK